MPRCLLLLLLVPFIGSCTLNVAQRPRELTVVYTGNLNGELEPCGCTEEGNLGGIRRQTTVIDRLRRTDPELFLLSSGGLFNSAIAADRINSKFILSGIAAQHYDAVGVQWQDLDYGVGFLTASNLPLVASNWPGKTFAAQRRIRHGNRLLAFFQWLDPSQSPYRTMEGRHFPVNADPAKLASAMQAAQAAGAVTVLATTLDEATVRKRLPVKWADIVILKSAYEKYGTPHEVNGTLFLQPGSRGQRIASVQVTLGGDHRIASYHQEIIPLPKSVPDAPRLADWYARFIRALKADYHQRVAERKRLAKQQSPYVGSESCKSCHAAAYRKWRQSRHARAFSALEQVNKAFDANCLTCHTVAFDEPGGFIDPDLTPDRLNVQCESCHGPGRQHVASGGKTSLAPAIGPDGPVCLRCHTKAHSPSFDFARYWPKIAHGHDAP